MLLISIPLLAEEECIFDQNEQRQAYIKLQEKYSGSRYVEHERKLVIPKDGQQITLKRGGCVHFGMTIELRTRKTERYEKEGSFFAEILALVTEYGQEFIDPKKLEKTIENKKWLAVERNGGALYFLYYETVTSFEVYRNHDGEQTTIGVSFYY